ncbi:hypothetical protein SPHV1_340002 [Novosphingobium sp. KN65.2]|nr:hypothetical protein SPHV1_340002 [Novosphingobium sp. KN65.2]
MAVHDGTEARSGPLWAPLSAVRQHFPQMNESVVQTAKNCGFAQLLAASRQFIANGWRFAAISFIFQELGRCRLQEI